MISVYSNLNIDKHLYEKQLQWKPRKKMHPDIYKRLDIMKCTQINGTLIVPCK